MDDIKVFNAGDLLKGVKLDFSGSPGQGSFAKDLPLPALGTKQGTPNTPTCHCNYPILPSNSGS